MLKKLIAILFLFGLQTHVLSINSFILKQQSIDTITPVKNIKKQLTPKEIKDLKITNVDFNTATCFQLMKGVIFNAGDKKPMYDVHIILSLDNKISQEVITNKTGRFTLKLLCNKTYDLKIKKTGFEDQFITFKSDIKSNTTIKKDFLLQGAYCYQTISGNITSSKERSFINNVTVSLLQNNQVIKTVQTLEDGTYSFSLDCSKSYTIKAIKDSFHGNSISFNTSLVPQTALVKHIQLKKIDCYKTISGTVLTKQLKKTKNLNHLDVSIGELNPLVGLKNVEVSISKDGEQIKSSQTNSNGTFTFTIPCNSTYTLGLKKENYNVVSKKIEINSDKKETQHFDIQLSKKKCMQILSGVVKNSKNQAGESNVLLKLLNNNLVISKTTSATDGSYTFKTDCYKSYKVTASKKNFTVGIQYFVAEKKHNATIKKIIKINPLKEITYIKGSQNLKLNPNNLTFILNKKDLTDALIKELRKVIILMKKNTSIKLEIKVHTDSRADDNLNMTLSKQRAETIFDYLTTRGVPKERLATDGYGETQLLNKCANGVKCSNFEHLKNRRIDFIVTDK